MTQLGQHGRQVWTNLKDQAPGYFTKALIYKSAISPYQRIRVPLVQGGGKSTSVQEAPALPRLKMRRKARRTAPVLPEVLHQSGPGGASSSGPGLTLLTNRGTEMSIGPGGMFGGGGWYQPQGTLRRLSRAAAAAASS